MLGWCITFGIVLLLILLLQIPLQFEIRWDKQTQFSLRYGFLPVLRSAPKRPAAKKRQPDRKTTPPKKTNTWLSKITEQQEPVDIFLEVCDLLARVVLPLKRLLRHITVTRFRVSVIVAGEDATETALQYGRVCAVFYPLRGIFAGLMRFRENHAEIYPDFHGNASCVQAVVCLWVRPQFILNSLVVLGIQLLASYLHLTSASNAYQPSPKT